MNLSRGDFPAMAAARSDRRTREFMVKLRRAVEPTGPNLRKNPFFLFASSSFFLPFNRLCCSLRCLLRAGLCAKLPLNDCWSSRLPSVRTRRRQLSLEESVGMSGSTSETKGEGGGLGCVRVRVRCVCVCARMQMSGNGGGGVAP